MTKKKKKNCGNRKRAMISVGAEWRSKGRSTVARSSLADPKAVWDGGGGGISRRCYMHGATSYASCHVVLLRPHCPPHGTVANFQQTALPNYQAGSSGGGLICGPLFLHLLNSTKKGKGEENWQVGCEGSRGSGEVKAPSRDARPSCSVLGFMTRPTTQPLSDIFILSYTSFTFSNPGFCRFPLSLSFFFSLILKLIFKLFSKFKNIFK